MLLSHKDHQGGQEVNKRGCIYFISILCMPILRFHLLYHGLGKWASLPLNISAVGPGEKMTMAVWNHHSGHSFLDYCGQDESIFLASAADKKHCASSVSLVIANGTLIKTWSKCEASLVLSKGHAFTQNFHIADVTDSILSADFFASNWLAIDMSNKNVILVLTTSMWL